MNLTALAYHSCPSLPAAFTQPGASPLADLRSGEVGGKGRQFHYSWELHKLANSSSSGLPFPEMLLRPHFIISPCHARPSRLYFCTSFQGQGTKNADAQHASSVTTDAAWRRGVGELWSQSYNSPLASVQQNILFFYHHNRYF